MAPRTLIEQVATRYRQLDSLGSAIEKNILNNEFAPLPEMCAQLNALQEEAKALDSELLDVLRQRQDLRYWRLASCFAPPAWSKTRRKESRQLPM